MSPTFHSTSDNIAMRLHVVTFITSPNVRHSASEAICKDMSLLSSWRYTACPASAEQGPQRMQAYFRHIVIFLDVTHSYLLLRLFTKHWFLFSHSEARIKNAVEILFYNMWIWKLVTLTRQQLHRAPRCVQVFRLGDWKICGKFSDELLQVCIHRRTLTYISNTLMTLMY
jgi:hypothetical protein